MVKQSNVPVINTSPSEAQIANAIAAGWEYFGDGEFMKSTSDNDVMIGHYTNLGFKIE